MVLVRPFVHKKFHKFSCVNIRFHQPQGPLQDLIEYIAFLEGYVIGNGIAFQRTNQVIIINVGSNFSVADIYAPASTGNEVKETIWINGKQEHSYFLRNPGTTSMYAIGLRLGALPFIAGLPAIETNDSALGAEHWSSAEFFELREKLLACKDVRSGFAMIENFLCDLLARKDLSQLERVKWLSHSLVTHRVEELCRLLGVTRKQLRNEGLRYYGGSVRQIQGILRFNEILGAIARDTDGEKSSRTLSGLHDYYDQAHFIHDFKQRAGITPMQYRALCRHFPAIRYTPNFLPMDRETFLQFIS